MRYAHVALAVLGVIASAAVVALGVRLADPIIGLLITLVILRITWQSWRTVRAEVPEDREEEILTASSRRS